MTQSIRNPKYYRAQDVKVGSMFNTEKYFHNGIIDGENFKGEVEIWGIVTDIPNEHFCNVHCVDLRFGSKIFIIPENRQYNTSINFWKGGKRRERFFSTDKYDDDEPTEEQLLELEKIMIKNRIA